MQNMCIGIDPGLSGAVAAIDPSAGLIGIWDTPSVTVKSSGKLRRMYVPAQMALILKNLAKTGLVTVCLELVRAMPGQGVVSMFSLGHGVGLWEGIIAGLDLPIVQVTPVVWKKAMLKGGVGQDKSASIVQACRLFPAAAWQLTRKKDDGRAEALLIAEYLRSQTYKAAQTA